MLEKENFLRTRLVPLLQRLDPATSPVWGRMSVQGMIEHMAHDAVMNANGKLTFDKIVTAPEHLQKMREFLASEKPFRPNTKNPLMKEEPEPLKYRTVQAAINRLQEELIDFFIVFQKEPSKVILNPFFGQLNFEMNVQLLYKHSIHHLKQFGVNLPEA